MKNSGDYRIKYGFDRHPEKNVDTSDLMYPDEQRVFKGSDIPDELYITRVIDTTATGKEPEVDFLIGTFKEEVSSSQSNMMWTKDWDTGQPRKVTSTPLGDKNPVDVSMLAGGVGFYPNPSDVLSRLEEKGISTDKSTFVPDTAGSDAVDQVQDNTIGDRVRFTSTYAFKIHCASGYAGYGEWVYNPTDNIDLGTDEFVGFVAKIGDLDYLSKDASFSIILEDADGTVCTWEIHKRDVEGNFTFLYAAINSLPAIGPLSALDKDNISKVTIKISPNDSFYTDNDGSDATICYIEKCIYGDLGFRVDTEIDEVNANFEMEGALMENIKEERFSGDGGTTAFDLANTAERLIEAEVFENGTWGDVQASLTGGGDTVTFSSAPPSGTGDNIRVVYTPKHLGGGVASDKNDLFSSETINDGNVHSSSVVDASKFRHLSLYVKLYNFGGAGPSQVRVTEKAGNSSVQGEETYWDITDITDGDEIVLPITDEFATTHIQVDVENKDGSPTLNYCDVDMKVFSKS